jgi:hypothetical protein
MSTILLVLLCTNLVTGYLLWCAARSARVYVAELARLRDWPTVASKMAEEHRAELGRLYDRLHEAWNNESTAQIAWLATLPEGPVRDAAAWELALIKLRRRAREGVEAQSTEGMDV